MARTRAWVRQQARYRIVDIVASVIEGGALDERDYSPEEENEVSAEIRRILARNERYAAQLGRTDRHA